MTKLIASLVFLFSIHTVFAQEGLENKISVADAIIEGKVIEKESFWNQDHSSIYTYNKIEVHKVFKGRIDDKYISVITSGGIVDSSFQFTPHSHQLGKLTEGLFFLERTKKHQYKMAYLEKLSNSHYKSKKRHLLQLDGKFGSDSSIYLLKGTDWLEKKYCSN